MGGAVGSIVGSVAGGLIGAKGAKDAAQTQADAAKDSNKLQYQMFQQTREDQAPYRSAGGASLNQLGFLLGLGAAGVGMTPPVRPVKGAKQSEASYQAQLRQYRADRDAVNAKMAQISRQPGYGSLSKSFSQQDFQADPGYQFRMDEGIKGLDRSAAARGGLLSGAALKGINRFSQDFASNEYGNAYNRFNTDQSNKFNRLASLAGIGQTATNQVSQAGQNYATNAGNNIVGAGNAMAAGQVGVSNALSGALNNYQQYNMLNSLTNQNKNLTSPQSFAQWGGGTNDYQGYY